jgi:3-hydroxybutyryl-CoA dehydrogenase
MEIRSVGIIGAGTMGAGIAQICAMKSLKTIVYDLEQKALDKAKEGIENNLNKGILRGKVTEIQKSECLHNLHFTLNLEDLIVDLIIEAVIERLDIKQGIFNKLAQFNSNECILASNTSSIPISQIAAGIPNPERVVGMHFFNPAHIMKLVEVISGAATAPNVAEKIKELAVLLGKTPVMVKDSPGFIVNRVARHFYLESMKCLEEGIADHNTIDLLIKNAGFKMGPFSLMDLIGIDTNYSVTTSMYESFYYEPRFRPSRIQKQKVDAGLLGKKSGKGFYDYSDNK